MRPKTLIFTVVLVCGFIGGVRTYGFESRGQDCAKCHTLGQDDAKNLLKHVIPDMKVHQIGMSPVKGLWEVFFESGGRKGLIYIDFGKKFIFSGSLISIADRRNFTQERFNELNRADLSQIPLDDALVMGEKAAKYKVIVFDDPECPYCAKLHQEMKKIVAERKDIAFYIKMFPLKIHPQAYDKAKAILCEKSIALLSDAHDKKPLPKPSCETTLVDEHIKQAQKLGLNGTPALIMPDGRIVQGYREASVLIPLITQ
jgi:thiol:disulfide interchange protein DsbC